MKSNKSDLIWNMSSHGPQITLLSSVQWLSRIRLFVTPWEVAARQASLSITNSRNSPRHTSIKSVMPSSHLILCRPLLLLPPIPPSIRVFSNESTLRNESTSLVVQTVKHLSTMWETSVRSLGWEDSLKKEMATYSSTLALKIPWMEELGAGYYPWGHKQSGTTERLHFMQ